MRVRVSARAALIFLRCSGLIAAGQSPSSSSARSLGWSTPSATRASAYLAADECMNEPCEYSLGAPGGGKHKYKYRHRVSVATVSMAAAYFVAVAGSKPH